MAVTLNGIEPLALPSVTSQNAFSNFSKKHAQRLPSFPNIKQEEKAQIPPASVLQFTITSSTDKLHP